MRHTPILTLLTILLVLFICTTTNSCTKSPQQPVTPIDSLPNDTTDLPDTFSVANQWQCTIDGISYSGPVDSSFMQMIFPYTPTGYEDDSLIIAVGTSVDKKAHIHFNANMNRNKYPLSGINGSHSYLVFDTASDNLYLGNISSATGPVYYVIDTFINNNALITFNGVLTDQKNVSHNISGKFSCKLNTGNNNPNKYACWADSNRRAGYFISSKINANTLVMQGINYTDYYSLQDFQIVVRTGGTIKPGVYKSSNGDVGFYCVGDTYHPFYYVDDSIGNMTLTIESIEGNVVRGSFSGGDNSLGKITDGSFACTVANYIPESISSNRWSMDMLGDPSFFRYYECFAGNIINAEKKYENGRYYLTLNGQSDNNASAFKIVISSQSPIAKSQYKLHELSDESIDTIYFISGVLTWNGFYTKYIADHATAGYGGEMYLYIDEIDDKHVTGRFYGNIYSNDHGNTFGAYVSKAAFNAAF